MNFLRKVAAKLKIDIFLGVLLSEYKRITWKRLNILSAYETINYLLNKNASMARFGDGELQILAYGCPLKFQRADSKLQQRLKEISMIQEDKLLICLPNRLNIVGRKERKELTPFWQKALTHHLYNWTKTFSSEGIYGDTNVSRLTEGKTEEEKRRIIDHIKKLWENRNVIMVEGKLTRFGVGNDLLTKAQSVERILGPAESAFDSYDIILEKCIERAKYRENPLFLIALGPTATVLAYDLFRNGYQAIDIGHLDISFEMLKTGTSQAITGKYTNEIPGGDIVSNCVDPTYLSEIVCVIT